MLALVNAGEMDEGRCQEYIGRTALLQLLRKHGYDGKGGGAGFGGGDWQVATGRHGRVSPADPRAAVEDERIMPTARVFRSHWDRMMSEQDLSSRRRMATARRDLLAGP